MQATSGGCQPHRSEYLMSRTELHWPSPRPCPVPALALPVGMALVTFPCSSKPRSPQVPASPGRQAFCQDGSSEGTQVTGGAGVGGAAVGVAETTSFPVLGKQPGDLKVNSFQGPTFHWERQTINNK